MSQRILITAATGTVGRHVVSELADVGKDVVAGTRDPDAATERTDTGAGFVEFDFERPETWEQALENVESVFLVRPPTVGVSEIKAFVDAAARAEVERTAYLSTLGAEKNIVIPHRRIERHIEGSGLTYTHLRASFFSQNLHEVHGRDIVENDEIFVPAGGGKTSFVDARDVAAVAAHVLTEPGHEKIAYDLTGPEALGYDEVAAVFSDVLGRKITYPAPSIPSFVLRMRRRDNPMGYILLMVGIYTTARLGLADRVTDDVKKLLGRSPRDIRTYVSDYAEEFRV